MFRTSRLPEKSMPGIYQDFLHNLPQATRFLGPHYSEPAAFVAKAEQVCAKFSGEREQLAEMLLAYNRRMGCSGAAEGQIEKLRDRRAVAVLCGQQAGLLTGPLYTIYKAICAVKLAAKLEEELGRPVVPVFWIAAEDHDFSEANHCYVQDKEGKPRRIQLELVHGGEPVGQLVLTELAGREVLAKLAATVPGSEFVAEMMAWLEEARSLATTPVDWFARIMAKLFAGEGLVLFEPLLAEARPLASGVFRQAIEQREEAESALALREAALRAEGYRLQVEREPGATLLLLLGKKRTALYRRNGHFVTRDGLFRQSEAELLARAAAMPESLSANVLLRPLVQDKIFPTLAYIPGPGELAYFAQATALYPVFGIEQPLLWPRPGVTLVERRLTQYLEKYRVAEEEILQGLDKALAREIKKKSELDLESIFAHLRGHLALEYEHLKRDLAKLNPQLGVLADKNLALVYNQVSYLEDKAREEDKKKSEVMMRHFLALEQTLKPNGKLQERVYCLMPFLFKYGPAFWEQLVSECPHQPGHHLLYL
ncbi:MAG: bacillithiol biosynthesis cysteine-adding enzyme BshC [Dethiobacter sp.]|nr:bacillithiol biosynthesis cysteine-adding enzyme BshC [Dethiobacter sp.]MBS3900806.1 bacillithiol biosynthesis cysteine-adding enzyme BshC [Dethiobacter sp.]MBS3988746.1 bacillithiol biosynthesis cysteine-adding enzyme BshC [Dethiobacter sp.]